MEVSESVRDNYSSCTPLLNSLHNIANHRNQLSTHDKIKLSVKHELLILKITRIWSTLSMCRSFIVSVCKIWNVGTEMQISSNDIQNKQYTLKYNKFMYAKTLQHSVTTTLRHNISYWLYWTQTQQSILTLHHSNTTSSIDFTTITQTQHIVLTLQHSITTTSIDSTALKPNK